MKEEGNEEEQERTVLFELRWHEDQTHGNKQTHIKEGSFKESLKKREKKRKKKKKAQSIREVHSARASFLGTEKERSKGNVMIF